MKKFRLIAAIVAVSLIVCLFTACGASQKGEPYTFTNFAVKTFVDPNAAEAETGAPAEEYEETLFEGEVIVYSETGEITLKDVILAYCDAQNVDYTFNEELNQFTKINGLSANGGCFWNFTVRGADKGLSASVKPEDAIVISFSK